MASRESRFTIPDSVVESSYDIPDSVKWNLYKGDLWVDNGVTSFIGGSPNSRGIRILARYDFDMPEEHGEYDLEFVFDDINFVANEKISIEEAVEELLDEYTIDGELEVELDLDDVGDNPTYTVYQGNTKVVDDRPDASDCLVLDVSHIDPTLDPLQVIVEGTEGYFHFRVFRINPSILLVLNDLRKYIDRLNMNLRIDSLKFTNGDYLFWLQHGRDRFNSIPMATNFTMTEAEGPIRDLWLVCSQVEALRTRYLEEGLTTYSYGGASVTLDVDVTTFLESQASTLETRITDEGQRLKTSLHTRGVRGGSGKWSTKNFVTGAAGRTIGIASTRRYYN